MLMIRDFIQNKCSLQWKITPSLTLKTNYILIWQELTIFQTPTLPVESTTNLKDYHMPMIALILSWNHKSLLFCLKNLSTRRSSHLTNYSKPNRHQTCTHIDPRKHLRKLKSQMYSKGSTPLDPEMAKTTNIWLTKQPRKSNKFPVIQVNCEEWEVNRNWSYRFS